MNNPVVKWGLISGLTSGVVMLILFFVNKDLLFNMTLTFVYPIVLSSLFLFFLFREIKANEDGYLGYGQAVVSGLLMFLIAGVVSGIFTYLLHNVIDPSFYEYSNQKALEVAENTARSFGLDEGAIDDMIEQTKSSLEAKGDKLGMTDYFLEYVMKIVGGLIMSLIVGAFMKKSS